MHVERSVALLPEATDDQLHQLLRSSADRPVLLYFTVPWCGPCKTFGPLMDRYADRRPEVLAYRVDCEANPLIAAHFEVGLFPTLALLRHRTVHWSRSGAMEADELEATVDAILEAASRVRAGDETAGTRARAFPPAFALGSGADPRMRVEAVRRDPAGHAPEVVETVQPGSTILVSEADGLRILIESDERLSRPLDLAALADLPPAPYEYVIIHSRSFPAAELEYLTGLREIGTLLISALEPLEPDAFEVLTRVRARSVHAQIPGVDAEHLRRRIPGTTVNYASLSAALVEHLPPAATAAAPIRWTTVDQLNRAVAAGGRVVAMVQLEHPADGEAGQPWHSMARTGELAAALTVSAYGHALAGQLALEPIYPAIVVWESGELVQRLDLPFTEAGISGLTLLSGTGRGTFAGPVPDRRARSLSLPDSTGGPVRLELVAPGTSSSGAVVELGPERSEDLPEGWYVRARSSLHNDEDGRWSEWGTVGVQALHLEGTITEQTLVHVAGLSGLEHLEIMSSNPPSPEALASAVATMPSLVSIRVHGLSSAGPLGGVRDSLIVNGEWPPSTGRERNDNA